MSIIEDGGWEDGTSGWISITGAGVWGRVSSVTASITMEGEGGAGFKTFRSNKGLGGDVTGMSGAGATTVVGETTSKFGAGAGAVEGLSIISKMVNIEKNNLKRINFK